MKRLLLLCLLCLAPLSYAEEQDAEVTALSAEVRVRRCGSFDGKPYRCLFFLNTYDCETGVMTFRRENGTGGVTTFKGNGRNPPISTICKAINAHYR